MAEAVLIDTGPLVAFFNRSDNWHDWAKKTMFEMQPPLITCEAVLSETLFLVKNNPAVVRALNSMIQEHIISVEPALSNAGNHVLDSVLKYSDLPGSLADLSLVYLYELQPKAFILTLDSDFHIYRDSKNRALRLIMG